MKAAIYCRLSKEDEGKTGESESIQNQKAMLIGYALENGFEVYQIYCDEDYSGIDRERPAFHAMLQAAEEHRFDVVLAKTQSRFTREMELVEKYLHGKFVEWGIRFIAVVDHVDTDDRANKKSRQINGLINEWYLEDLSDNVRAVLDHKRKEGVHIGSSALYGYRKDPGEKGRLLIDPEAAGVVRRIFAMALGGAGARRIARTLNDEGTPCPAVYKQQKGACGLRTARTPEAALWQSATIYQMLHNQTYAGSLVQGRHKKVSYKTKKTIWLPRSQWIVVPGTHEAIVDPDTFDTVQKMMQGRTRSGAAGQIHPLAGKVVCGCCGSVMEQTARQPGADGTRIRYVRCRMHQRAPERCGNRTCTNLDELQKLVLERIRACAADQFDPEKIAAAEQKALLHGAQAERGELDRLKREVEQRRRAVRELYLDKASGLIDAAQFAEMNRAFREEAEKTEAQIGRLEVELERQKEEGDTAPARVQRVRELARIPQLTRELAALLIERIVLSPKDPLTGRENVRIEWSF